MIIGIGTDIVDIDRIRQKIEKNTAFRDYVFSEDEINYCEQKHNSFESYASRFAAKEAFLKALGTGIDLSFELKELEVSVDDKGRPSFSYSTLVRDTLLEKIGTEPAIFLSISHSANQAIAFVIFDKILE